MDRTQHHVAIAQLHDRSSRLHEIPYEERARHVSEIHSALAVHTAALSGPTTVTTATDYLSRLAQLQTDSLPSINLFNMQANTGNKEYIPLGVHNGYKYAILPSSRTIPHTATSNTTALDDLMGTTDIVSAFDSKRIPGSSPSAAKLRFGFGLGRLVNASVGDDTAYYSDAGFYILFNIVDKSIWIAFDFQPQTETGDVIDIDPSTSSNWGFLEDDDGLQIGAMKISDANWYQTDPPVITSASDPFTINPPLACQIIAGPAIVRQWKEALTAAQAPAAG